MQYSVHAAKTNLSKLIEAVEKGEAVTITRHGTPVVDLVPARRGAVRLGHLKGVIAPPPDEFYAPMTDEELADWDAV